MLVQQIVTVTRHYILRFAMVISTLSKVKRTQQNNIQMILGHEKVTDVLIEHEANVNIPDNNGWTALHWAAQNGNVQSNVIFIWCLYFK